MDGYPGTSVADDAMLAIARYQLEVMHDAAAAQATAESLVKKFPASDSVPSAYVVAGQAQVARGLTPANVDSALASFERVPRLFPGSDGVAPALYASGDTLRRLGRCPEALERFGRWSIEYPRTTWASLARLGAGACLAATGSRSRDGSPPARRQRVPGQPAGGDGARLEQHPLPPVRAPARAARVGVRRTARSRAPAAS